MKVLYDGNCSVCAKFKKIINDKDQNNRFLFIDINDSDKISKLSAISNHKLTSKIHVITKEKEIISGMDGIRVISKELGYNKFSKISSLPILDKIFNLSYFIISRNRKIISLIIKN